MSSTLLSSPSPSPSFTSPILQHRYFRLLLLFLLSIGVLRVLTHAATDIVSLKSEGRSQIKQEGQAMPCVSKAAAPTAWQRRRRSKVLSTGHRLYLNSCWAVNNVHGIQLQLIEANMLSISISISITTPLLPHQSFSTVRIPNRSKLSLRVSAVKEQRAARDFLSSGDSAASTGQRS
jgi:hypothetical protein